MFGLMFLVNKCFVSHGFPSSYFSSEKVWMLMVCLLAFMTSYDAF